MICACATRHTLAVIAWLGVLIFAAGLVAVSPTVMAIGACIAAVAGTGWGLLMALDQPDVQMVHDREAVWARRDAEAEQDELPYAPSEHAPFWDTEVFGAPE